MRILCLTPVNHILGIQEILLQCGDVCYLVDPDIQQVKDCINQFHPDTLFVNPNKMKYKLISDILSMGIKTVATASTGTNHIDMDYCRKNNITVLSLTEDYPVIEKISSTAEMAFALMLSLIRNIPRSFDDVKQYNWDYTKFIGRQLNAMTVGILGYGRLGKMFAKYCKAFDMDIIIHDPYKMGAIVGDHHACVGFSEIMQYSDIISIHVHLNKDTKNVICKSALDRIKPGGCYLINTSRGDVVKEQDIINALEKKILLGYATDVLSHELGNLHESPILQRVNDLNIIVTPHIGGMTEEAQSMAYTATAKKLLALSTDKNIYE